MEAPLQAACWLCGMAEAAEARPQNAQPGISGRSPAMQRNMDAPLRAARMVQCDAVRCTSVSHNAQQHHSNIPDGMRVEYSDW